jgi:hypothetical protein
MNDDLEAKEDTNEELLAKLWVVLDGMKLAEELVVPTLSWDPQAEDADEVRALKRAGLLFAAYEPAFFWCFSFGFWSVRATRGHLFHWVAGSRSG